MSEWLDAEGHADRAQEMYERGRFADAEAELRKALALNPSQPEWLINLGVTLEASGRDADALKSYEDAIVLLPDQPIPLLAAGIICNRLGRFGRAIELLEQTVRLEPSPDAFAHLMEAHLRAGNHDETETTFYLAQMSSDTLDAACLAVMAESLIERGIWDRAEWCLKEALRIEPSMPRLRARLGVVYSATDRRQRALQMFLRDLRDDPGNIDTLLDYGELLFELGRLPEAAEKFRRVLELEPANVDAHFQLGLTAMASRRYEQAHLEFELVLKLDPHFPGIRTQAGESALRQGRIETARRFLTDEFLRLQRNEANAGTVDLPRLGTLLLEADHPRESAAVFRMAIDDHGATPPVELLRRLALALYRADDREQGTAVSQDILNQDPDCVVSMHNLALAAFQGGRLDEACHWIRRGLKVDRHDVGLRRLRIRAWLGQVGRWLSSIDPRPRRRRV